MVATPGGNLLSPLLRILRWLIFPISVFIIGLLQVATYFAGCWAEPYEGTREWIAVLPEDGNSGGTSSSSAPVAAATAARLRHGPMRVSRANLYRVWRYTVRSPEWLLFASFAGSIGFTMERWLAG